jgi:hypothetical protein
MLPVSSFSPWLQAQPSTLRSCAQQNSRGVAHCWVPRTSLGISLIDDVNEEEEEEGAEPGKMRISEIKAELDLRQISYAGCFDKESLVQRLEVARASGRADPKILETFNKQKLEQQFKEEKVDINDEDIDAAVANDGKLPGGLTPEQFKTLSGNPEIMKLLQSTKLQEAMKLMMTGGREELEQKLRDDPGLQETVQKLDSTMKGIS